MNKQPSASDAGFRSVLIRLVKFKSLIWEVSPIILAGFVFVFSLNCTGNRLPHSMSVSMCVQNANAHLYSSAAKMLL